MATIYFKLFGTKEIRIAALKGAHPDLVGKDEEGKDEIRNHFTHDIAIMYYPQLTLPSGDPDTAPAVAGPHFMVKFLKGQKLGTIDPMGLVQKWKAGGAPVKFLGDR